jgi:uncharacterized protein (TIGR02466 family)
MITKIFPIKIFEAEFPDYHLIKESLTDEILSFYSDDDKKNDYTFYPKLEEIHDLHKKIKHKEILEFIENNLKIYWKELNYTDQLEPKIFDMVANYMPKHTGKMHLHYHPQEVSAVFYVDVDNQSGPIIFHNPLESLLSRLPFYEKDSSNEHVYCVNPKPGKLLLFPGYLAHEVGENLSNMHRISLICDCGIYKQTYLNS